MVNGETLQDCNDLTFDPIYLYFGGELVQFYLFLIKQVAMGGVWECEERIY